MKNYLFIILFQFAVSAVFTQNNYRIVYNVLDDTAANNYAIYSMNMDGSDKKKLTHSTGVEWTYYTFKNTIYFVSDKDTCSGCYFLYSMNAEGSDVKKISNLQLEDSWMSARNNGEEMIVSGRAGKSIRYQLFLIDLRSGDFMQLTFDSIAAYVDPLFLNEYEFVFRYKKKRKNREINDELYKMSLINQEMKRLTYFPADDTTAEWHHYHAGPPKFNHTEKFITYQSFQKNDYHIYAITPDGEKQWKLTENTIFNEGWHDWSPDGKWITFDIFNREQDTFDIYLMNWETGEMKQLTDSWKFEQAPVFVEIK